MHSVRILLMRFVNQGRDQTLMGSDAKIMRLYKITQCLVYPGLDFLLPVPTAWMLNLGMDTSNHGLFQQTPPFSPPLRKFITYQAKVSSCVLYPSGL